MIVARLPIILIILIVLKHVRCGVFQGRLTQTQEIRYRNVECFLVRIVIIFIHNEAALFPTQNANCNRVTLVFAPTISGEFTKSWNVHFETLLMVGSPTL